MENCDKSYESMDVDMSGNSVTQMDISYNDSHSEVKIKKEKIEENVDTDYSYLLKTKIKTEPEDYNQSQENETEIEIPKPINVIHIQKFPVKVNNTQPQIKITFFILIIVLGIIIHHLVNFKCSEELDLEDIKSSLSNQVFGQSKAINFIMNALSAEGTKILFFYGGTGVGKTYTASIIMESFKASSNLYHYTMPSFEDNFSTDFKYGLIVCKSSMFVLDGLTTEDKQVNEHIKDLIKKGQELKKNITIILIYSCDNANNNYIKKCDENFNMHLTEDFKDLNVQMTFVKFDQLNEINLRQCIEREAKNQNIRNVNYEKLLKNFDVATDGCKGVHTKMKLLHS